MDERSKQSPNTSEEFSSCHEPSKTNEASTHEEDVVNSQRKRIMTEKGKQYTVTIKRKLAVSKDKELRNEMHTFDLLVSESCCREEIKRELQKMMELSQEALDTLSEWLDLVEEPIDVRTIIDMKNALTCTWENSRRNALDKINRLNMESEDQISQSSRSSCRSRRSRRSDTRTVFSLQDAKVKKHILKDRLKYVDLVKEQEKVLEKLKLQQELSETLLEENILAAGTRIDYDLPTEKFDVLENFLKQVKASPQAPQVSALSRAPQVLAFPQASQASASSQASQVKASPQAPQVSALSQAPQVLAFPQAPQVSALSQASHVSAFPQAPQASASSQASQVKASPQAPQVSALSQAPQVLAFPQASQASASSQASQVSAFPQAPQVKASPQAPQVSASSQASQVSALPQAPQVKASPQAPQVSALSQAPQVLAFPQTPQASALSQASQVSALSQASQVLAFPQAPQVSALSQASHVSAFPQAPQASALSQAPQVLAFPQAPQASTLSQASEVTAFPRAAQVSALSQASEVAALSQASQVLAVSQASQISASPQAPRVSAFPQATQVSASLQSAQINAFPQAPHTQTSSQAAQVNAVLQAPHYYSSCQPVYVPKSTDSSHQVVEMLSRVAQLQRLPLAKPDIFRGDEEDRTKFFLWETAFDALIDSAPVSENQKLYLLYQYLDGKAKQVVQMLQFTTGNPDVAYRQARKKLKERFGHRQIICTEFEDRLDNWPNIGPNDPQGLREFSDFLLQIQFATEQNPNMKIYEFPSKLQTLVEKMPGWFKGKWSNQVQVLQQNQGQDVFPSFSDFVSQVKFHAERMNIPQIAYSAKTSTKPSGRKLQNKQLPNKTIRGSSTVIALASKTENSSESREEKTKEKVSDREKNSKGKEEFCLYHKTKTHSLSVCKKFLDLSGEERKQFLFKNRLCFNCGNSDQHTAKACKKGDPKCETCGGRHLTILHDSGKAENSSTKCTHVCQENRTARSCARIVLVKIFHQSNSLKEILTYAVLDDQSTDVFITENLLNELDVEGSKINLQVNTITGTNTVRTTKIHGLRIQDVNNNYAPIKIPHAYTRDAIPATHYEIVTPDIARKWKHLEEIADEIKYRPDVHIGLLIGRNVPSAFQPLRVIYSEDNEPWGEEYKFGWTVIGCVCVDANSNKTEEEEIVSVNRVTVRKEDSNFEVSSKSVDADQYFASKDVTSPRQIRNMMQLDYSELYHSRRISGVEQVESVEDNKFCQILRTKTIRNEEGYWEVPLPFRSESVDLPDNKEQCIRRLLSLKRRLVKNEKVKRDYLEFMQKILDRNHAERVPADEIPGSPGKVWYIPHFDVYHPRKPDQVRVVYDCSAVFLDTSLNKQLLPGPDLTNSLLGVLLRFREEEVAITCDVEQMFHSFHVSPRHRDFLRFLWFEGNNLNGAIIEYRMRVHIFGAISSPAVANFCLLKTAEEGRSKYGDKAADFLCNNFYVDDGLKSVATIQEAINLVKNSKAMCAESNLRLHKFASNKKEVLHSVTNDDRAKSLKDLDLRQEPLPVQRSLGTVWCIESDCFKFRIELKDTPLSRRGILSTISSIYDPLGIISPVLLKGKQILQELCRLSSDWDDPVPDAVLVQWERWRKDLVVLEGVKIPRCVKPEDFGRPVVVEIHNFSDASQAGIGQVSYLRMVNEDGKTHVSFLMAKSRVAPLKTMSTPRLELTAAVVSVNVATMLRKELSYDDPKLFFHTDSEVVIGYIHNETRRFHVYVGNRIQHIRDRSHPSQWYHVSGKENPADEASRSLSASELLENHRWLHGPNFLWNPHLSLVKSEPVDLSEDDVEVKSIKPTIAKVDNLFSKGLEVAVITGKKSEPQGLTNRLDLRYFDRFSTWYKAKLWVTYVKKGIKRLRRARVKLKEDSDLALTPISPIPSVEELKQSERVILRSMQLAYFEEEMIILRQLEGNINNFESRESSRNRNKLIKRTSSLYRLDPFVDKDGLLRVGGRLSRASAPFDVKYPLILPRNGHLTELIIRHFHDVCQHQGRGITHNAIRQAGFWIINGRSAIAYLISKCVKCRRLRGHSLTQKMSDLPEERITPSEPFLYSGVDVFGPWLIKEGRKSLKRYGLIFTCLASRGVHLETLNTMETDSFINALRRFMCRRGRVRVLRSDCGTNFVGANNELSASLAELDDERIKTFLLKQDCDWVTFKFNVPKASHMGGVWERMIRTVRSVLSSLLEQHGSQLDDESLRTIMAEAENIVNSRPLTVENLSDPGFPVPITPQQLLTSKTSIVSTPPGNFQPVDLYSRRRWRRVQFLTGLFWSRWRKEYCALQHQRQKWNKQQRDCNIGDVMLIQDVDLPRNQWPLGKVIKTIPSTDGRVRKVQLLVTKGDRRSLLERPVHKLILLVENKCN